MQSMVDYPQRLFKLLLFSALTIIALNSSLSAHSLSDTGLDISTDLMSDERMFNIGVDVLVNQFYHEDYRIMRRDFFPGGILESTTPVSRVARIRMRYSWIGSDTTQRIVMLKFSVDSTVSILDQLLLVEGTADEQNIDADILPRYKMIAVDNFGRFYFLRGFEENDAQTMVRNFMDETLDEEMFTKLMRIHLKSKYYSLALTPEYKRENPQITEKFGDLETSCVRNGDSLELTMYGDLFRAIYGWNEPVSSTIVKYNIRYSHGQDFEYTADTLGTINYPNRYD